MPKPPAGALTAVLRGAICAALLVLPAAAAAAHEVPADVVVRAFLRPEGGRLRLLVRVPLASMRDVVFPLRDGGYLDIPATRPLLADLADRWIAGYVQLFEDGTALGPETVRAARVSLPSDPSFATWTTALAHVLRDDLPPATDLVLEQALLDVLIEVPITSERARFALLPGWAHLGVRTSTALRFLPAGGGERAYRYASDPGLVRLDPRWHQSALLFFASGMRHILGGLDHLLFLLCLVIPLGSVRRLIPTVTAFAVAHSITLIAAAGGVAPEALWFPPLIESLIAASIVWLALENVLGLGLERRWLVAFGFGLVHGCGFAFGLREELQFAGSHLVGALLAFNLGVELGQIAVLAVVVPVLAWAFRRGLPERAGTIVLSVLVAHTAWHWMTQRGSELLRYRFEWPAWDAALLAEALRIAMVALIAVAAAWALSAVFERGAPVPPAPPRALAGGMDARGD